MTLRNNHMRLTHMPRNRALISSFCHKAANPRRSVPHPWSAFEVGLTQVDWDRIDLVPQRSGTAAKYRFSHQAKAGVRHVLFDKRNAIERNRRLNCAFTKDLQQDSQNRLTATRRNFAR